MSQEKINLRANLRKIRQQLNPQQHEYAAQQLTSHLALHPLFQHSEHIAGYIANDGEIALTYVMDLSIHLGKKYYLPVLHPLNYLRLWFVQYQQGDELITNRYGILEPKLETAKLIPPWALDLVLLPLVGFDETGERLGMGKGYYDQTFAFLQNPYRTKPYLLGVAHEAQKVKKITAEQWDVKLHGIITDHTSYNVSR